MCHVNWLCMHKNMVGRWVILFPTNYILDKYKQEQFKHFIFVICWWSPRKTCVSSSWQPIMTSMEATEWLISWTPNSEILTVITQFDYKYKNQMTRKINDIVMPKHSIRMSCLNALLLSWLEKNITSSTLKERITLTFISSIIKRKQRDTFASAKMNMCPLKSFANSYFKYHIESISWQVSWYRYPISARYLQL